MSTRESFNYNGTHLFHNTGIMIKFILYYMSEIIDNFSNYEIQHWANVYKNFLKYHLIKNDVYGRKTKVSLTNIPRGKLFKVSKVVSNH